MNSISTLFALVALATSSLAQIDLGSATPYGALAVTGITSAGLTIIDGDIGTTGASITGFPPGVFTGTTGTGTPAVIQARADALTAYNTAQGLDGIESSATAVLDGQTIEPGVYHYDSSVSLAGNLTLSGAGTYVFQIGSTLITAVGSAVILTNGAVACDVYWAVGSSVTLGATSIFAGNVLADVSITVDSAVAIEGGLYSGVAITLIDDIIAGCNATIPINSTSSSSSASSTATSTSLSLTSTSVEPTITTSSTAVPTTSSTVIAPTVTATITDSFTATVTDIITDTITDKFTATVTDIITDTITDKFTATITDIATFTYTDTITDTVTVSKISTVTVTAKTTAKMTTSICSAITKTVTAKGSTTTVFKNCPGGVSVFGICLL